jgi:hypothetical protein
MLTSSAKGEATLSFLEDWPQQIGIAFLATIYAAACKSLRPHDQVFDMHVEVDFPTNLIFGRNLHQWVVIVGGALDGVTTSLEWTKMVMELCTAIDFPTESYNQNDVAG